MSFSKEENSSSSGNTNDEMSDESSDSDDTSSSTSSDSSGAFVKDQSTDFQETGADVALIHGPKSKLFSPYTTLTVPCGKFVLNSVEGQHFVTLYNRNIWQICRVDKLHRMMQGSTPRFVKDGDNMKTEESDIVVALNDINKERVAILTKTRMYIFVRGIIRNVFVLNNLIVQSALSLKRENKKWTICIFGRKRFLTPNAEDETCEDSENEKDTFAVLRFVDIEDGTQEISHGGKEISLESYGMIIPDCMVHPPTYVNKLVVSGRDVDGNGMLLLINVRTGALVYEFKCQGSVSIIQRF